MTKSFYLVLIFLVAVLFVFYVFKTIQKSKQTSAQTDIPIYVNIGISAVPVVPNESIVTGKVLSLCVIASSVLGIQPEQTIYSLKVLIEKSEGVEGMRDFTKDKAGELVLIYTKEKLSLELFNKVIKTRVTYRGDEWGGSFWAIGVDVLEQEEGVTLKKK